MCHIYRRPSQDRAQLAQITATAVTLLESLGFLVNYPKSALTPVQEPNFPGILDRHSQEGAATPSREGTEADKGCQVHQMLSARALAGLLGKMSATIQAVHPAPLNRPIPYKG